MSPTKRQAVQRGPDDFKRTVKAIAQNIGNEGAPPEEQFWDEITVERDGDVPLVFDGFELGIGKTSVSCLDRLRNAYTERGHTVTIYKVRPTVEVTRNLEGQPDKAEIAEHRYVISFIAWSGVSTEVNRYKAIVVDGAAGVYGALKDLTAKGIPDAGLEALRKASMAEQSLKAVAVQRL